VLQNAARARTHRTPRACVRPPPPTPPRKGAGSRKRGYSTPLSNRFRVQPPDSKPNRKKQSDRPRTAPTLPSPLCYEGQSDPLFSRCEAG
jgi:hypothetical protein